MNNEYDDETKYKLIEATLTFELPENLPIDTAKSAIEFWLQKFDKHGVLDMGCTDINIRPLPTA